MSAAGCQLTQCNIPEDLHLKQHHLEDCKCCRSGAGKAVPWMWFALILFQLYIFYYELSDGVFTLLVPPAVVFPSDILCMLYAC